VQAAHGVYASPEAWTDENYILSLRCPKAIFSHDEALYYHDLIDREPENRTVTVYTGYGTGRLVKDDICVYTVKKTLLEVGKTTVLTSLGHPIPMYNQERTICDLVRNRSRFEIQDYQTALKTYATRKDKDLNRLMKYAKLFHVDGIIREYMEVML
jgi:predicted transcriptional regulator of viral defense system